MKIVTMYLPQFHVTEENNKWWGEGFTEWVAVKHAIPLFEDHNQPRKPKDDNYYNLLDKHTMIWQADLMKKYGIYGQCFYHYWFKDGKQVLEKPAENLLKWKDVQMPFCFSWANEPWVRSWSAMTDSNVWAQKYEPSKGNVGDNGILLEQEYGTECEWREHFDYLLPFFKDERYIKIDGKPVFMFYRPNSISRLREMVGCWNRWAAENGLLGIYFIGGNVSQKGCLDAVYFHATGSMFPAEYYRIHNSVKTISYDKVWEHMIAQGKMAQKGTYIGGMVDFDTTPRKGKNGIVVVGCSSGKYEAYLKKVLKLNEDLGNEITFINAWNEWGEGMYLEPDEGNGYAFLEATRRALGSYQKEEMAKEIGNHEKELLLFYKERMEEYKENWKIMDRWMRRKEQGNPLENTLKKKGIHRIAIYGLGMMGQHLKAEFEKSDIDIAYAIDTRKHGMKSEIPVLGLDDNFPQADAIIVSVVREFDEIAKELRKKTDIPVLPLEDILFD